MALPLSLPKFGALKRHPQIRSSDLLYAPFPRQREFHLSKARYRLFGGAAGPGKTKALLWEAISQAVETPGADTLLLRRTFPELEASLLAQFRRDVPSWMYRSYNESKHIVRWRNGSTTRFGYCRSESDVYQYQGAEFLFIGLDELTHFTLKQWQFLTSRNRCPIPGSRCSMAGATNPGNIGHAWVKALWVDHVSPPGFDRPELYQPNDYSFIRARLDDNPIYAKDAAYRRALEALPEHLRRAFLEGDWDVFAGQYFTVFDIGRHTARPEDVRLEPWLPRWISVDWGFSHPSAVYWHCAVPAPVAAVFRPRAVSSADAAPDISKAPPSQEGGYSFAARQPASAGHPERSVPPQASEGSQPQQTEPAKTAGPQDDPPGRTSAFGTRMVTYREFVQSGLSPRMLAQGIAERCQRERITDIFLSPDAFAHRTSEASIAEQLGDVLVANGLPRPVPADDDRKGGWQLMYQLLEADAWLITENCAKLIDCLPTLVRDEQRYEDVRKMEGDDPADAARYGLVSGRRFAGVGAAFLQPGAISGSPSFGAGGMPAPSSYGYGGAGAGSGYGGLPTGQNAGPRFVPGMPLGEQIARQVSATDPTSQAIHYQRLEAEAHKYFAPKKFFRRG